MHQPVTNREGRWPQREEQVEYVRRDGVVERCRVVRSGCGPYGFTTIERPNGLQFLAGPAGRRGISGRITYSGWRWI